MVFTVHIKTGKYKYNQVNKQIQLMQIPKIDTNKAFNSIEMFLFNYIKKKKKLNIFALNYSGYFYENKHHPKLHVKH